VRSTENLFIPIPHNPAVRELIKTNKIDTIEFKYDDKVLTIENTDRPIFFYAITATHTTKITVHDIFNKRQLAKGMMFDYFA
jgi:hypothetical protein